MLPAIRTPRSRAPPGALTVTDVISVRWTTAVLALCLVLSISVGGTPAVVAGTTAAVPVAELPGPPAAPPPASPRFLGASVRANSSSWRHVLAGSDTTGALVVAVVPFSPAHAAGLAPGDVIVAVDDRAVHNEEQLLRELRRGGTLERVLSVVRADENAWTPRVRLATAPTDDASGALLAQLGRHPDPANRFLFAVSARDPAAARAVLSQLVSELPEFALAHAALATRLAQLERNPSREEEVRAALSRALELDPTSRDVQVTAGSIFLDMNDLTAAEQHAARAVDLDPDSALAHHLLGRARLAGERPEDALPALRRAVHLDPYDPRYYRSLTEGYLAVGYHNGAAQTMAALRELETTVSRRQPENNGKGIPLALLVGAAALAGALFPLRHHRARHRRALSHVEEKTEPSEVALLEALAACGAFSVAVPALGRALALSPAASSHELANHVLPGVVAVVAAAMGLRRLLAGGANAASFLLGLSPVLLLPGMAITFWHVPVLLNAARGVVRWDAALFHFAAGPAIVVLAGWLAVRAWGAVDEDHGGVARVPLRTERATP